MSEPVMGVDIGGVVLRHQDYKEESRTGPRFRSDTELPGVREGMASLVRLFGGRVHLVSKCGPRTEERTRTWLTTQGFPQSTGLDPASAHFCRRRADKAGICAELGITHFVDDRLEVLSYLETVPHLYLFRPRSAEVDAYRHFLPQVHVVDSWVELVPAVAADHP